MSEVRHKGLLVVFEGIDGTGKSTHARLLEDHLREIGLDVIRSREPTQGPHGRALRESARRGRRPPQEELELFLADRRQHVAEVLRPALDADKVVLVDRYYLSTAAYQGARGLDPEEILIINESFAPIPDLAVLIEVPVDEGRRRIQHRGDGDGDLFEREEELQRVAAVFASLHRPYIVRLRSDQPVENLQRAIRECVESHPRFRSLLARARPGNSRHER